jgi:glycine dehydrogenase subunit 1
MTTTSKLIRRMPGRIIGQTHDASGRTGYVLTLQTREQHIRRERATSNICSNEALCALAATIYLATIGPKGLKEVGYQSTVKAHYVADRLQEKGYKLTFNAPFFQEFALSGVTPAQTKNLLKKGILSGVDLGFRYPELKGNTLWAVTEVRTRAELDNLVAALEVH